MATSQDALRRLLVRDAEPDADAAACAALYAPYVTGTAITFENRPPTEAEFAERIRAAQDTHAWLVCEELVCEELVCEELVCEELAGGEPARGALIAGEPPGRGRVVGYAYAGPFAARPAYRWACEVSVYGERGRTRTGLGRALYQVLLERLAARGYRSAVAKLTLPNEASLGLHRAFGFEPVGVHRRIGYKLGAWHDVAVAQLDLVGAGQDGGPDAPPPSRTDGRAGPRAAVPRENRIEETGGVPAPRVTTP